IFRRERPPRPLQQGGFAAFSLCRVHPSSRGGEYAAAISLELSAIAATISRHVEYHEISHSRPWTLVLAHDHHLSRSCVHFRSGPAHTGSAEHQSAALGLGDRRFHDSVRDI